MGSQIVIQTILITAVCLVGWMLLRSPGGDRHLAGRRLATLAFVVFAVVTIIFPSLTGHLARLVGVGRGTDLLLYALVVAFLVQVLTSFRRNAALERQLTRLARRVALDGAPAPAETGPARPTASGAAERTATGDGALGTGAPEQDLHGRH